MKTSFYSAVSAMLMTCALSAQTELLPLKSDGLPKLTSLPNKNCEQKEMIVPVKGTILQLNAKDGDASLETVKIKNLPKEGYLVYEVSACSAAKARMILIAVGYRYKSIETRVFELGSEWKKYAVAIRCDAGKKHQEFFGRIDFGKGQQIDIAKVRIYHIADLKELPADYEISMYGKTAYNLPYKVDRNAPAGKNMLPDDGYFSRTITPHLKPQGKNGVIALKKENFEKSDTVLNLTCVDKKNFARFATMDLPITGSRMVFEAMVRSVGSGKDTNCGFIAVASKYKYITHKQFELSSEWRKLTAIVEIPKDPKNVNVFWGFIDVPVDSSIEVGRVAVYSMNSDQQESKE